jgi:hypothetical protein
MTREEIRFGGFQVIGPEKRSAIPKNAACSRRWGAKAL